MNKVYTIDIIEAEDGSGDAILPLPLEFCQEDDWREGDVLQLDVVNSTIVIKNLSKEDRENLSK